jgi:hypothetical protein
VRNPEARKTPVEPWGRKPKKISFGTRETPFNEAVVDQLNLFPGVHVEKVAGTAFKKGWPDISGHFRRWSYLTENKFIDRVPVKDDTVALPSDAFSLQQRRFITKRVKALREAAEVLEDIGGPSKVGIVGGLIGVRGQFNIIIAVPAWWIIQQEQMTAYQVRDCIRVCREAKTPFIEFTQRKPLSGIDELVKELLCP